MRATSGRESQVQRLGQAHMLSAPGINVHVRHHTAGRPFQHRGDSYGRIHTRTQGQSGQGIACRRLVGRGGRTITLHRLTVIRSPCSDAQAR